MAAGLSAPSDDSKQAHAQRVSDLLEQMTLAEKIGQMTQVDKVSITPAEVADYHIGSVLSGGGGNPTPNNPQTWADMVRGYTAAALTTRLAIPLLYGTDAVHGHSNVRGAVIFPHNIGLGAARDAALMERIGAVTAAEVLATGANWTFAPTVAVAQDLRWGRIYESFGVEAELVAGLGAAYLRGLRSVTGEHPVVLESFKHYLADGGTRWGSRPGYCWLVRWSLDGDTTKWVIDQGDAVMDEETLRRVHLLPYQAAIAAGALNIMVSYSSWRTVKLHAHRYLLADLLKGELGFSGFLVSDHQAIDQLSPDYYACVVAAITAGVDMIMVPYEYRRFIATLTQAVENGDVSLARIDDAVRRILAVKCAVGLFEHPGGDETLLPEVGSAAHRAVAREAVRKSLVLLKNDGGLLPLEKAGPRLLVAGRAADDIGLQCGGWTIDWQGGMGPITPGTTLLEGIRAAASAATPVHYAPDGTPPVAFSAEPAA
ncbi:MAG: beta-glucosidase, partial [Anaerolineae bacterium]|nr:beta-glucosidase [Anaerolineae bacterium]